MDSNVLSHIYRGSAALNESVESIDNNLAKILKIEVKAAKQDKKDRKEEQSNRRRKAQLAKRKERDFTVKDEEAKKNVADTLKDSLGGLLKGLGGLLSGVGPILTGALSGLGGIVGPAITGGLSVIGGVLGSALTSVIKGLGSLVVKALTPIAGLLKTGLVKLAASGLLAVAAKVVALVAAPVAIAASIGMGVEALQRSRVGGGEAGDLRQEMYKQKSALLRKTRNGRGQKTREYTAEEQEQLDLIEKLDDELLEIEKEKKKKISDITVTERVKGTGNHQKPSQDHQLPFYYHHQNPYPSYRSEDQSRHWQHYYQ